MELSAIKSLRLRHIQGLVLRVEGVLTDGTVEHDYRGATCRRYSVRDGIGFALLRQTGCQIMLVAQDSKRDIAIRAKRLRLEVEESFYAALRRLRLRDSQVAYIGSEMSDVKALRQAGLAVAVADAVPAAKRAADAVTEAGGGGGAVREVCEFLVQEHQPRMLEQARACGLSL